VQKPAHVEEVHLCGLVEAEGHGPAMRLQIGFDALDLLAERC
jgi:hypothetical protein